MKKEPTGKGIEKVAIVGSREFSRLQLVRDYVIRLSLDSEIRSEIVSGGARGVDRKAEQTALSRGMTVHRKKPDYDTYGKGAPLIRNKEIAQECDRMVAFWDGQSRGTLHAIRHAEKRGKKVLVIVETRAEAGVVWGSNTTVVSFSEWRQLNLNDGKPTLVNTT